MVTQRGFAVFRPEYCTIYQRLFKTSLFFLGSGNLAHDQGKVQPASPQPSFLVTSGTVFGPTSSQRLLSGRGMECGSLADRNVLLAASHTSHISLYQSILRRNRNAWDVDKSIREPLQYSTTRARR